ncbi:MAG: hypothetical protein Q8R96_09315 [Bacteroidota bacterium]|nr:hypothetical protein [Bacteroidota bacterium]
MNVEDAVLVREITNLKKLTGYKNAYRIKIGNYRIGVFIENNIVEFARVIHRKDIYRVFP